MESKMSAKVKCIIPGHNTSATYDLSGEQSLLCTTVTWGSGFSTAILSWFLNIDEEEEAIFIIFYVSDKLVDVINYTRQ